MYGYAGTRLRGKGAFPLPNLRSASLCTRAFWREFFFFVQSVIERTPTTLLPQKKNPGGNFTPFTPHPMISTPADKKHGVLWPVYQSAGCNLGLSPLSNPSPPADAFLFLSNTPSFLHLLLFPNTTSLLSQLFSLSSPFHSMLPNLPTYFPCHPCFPSPFPNTTSLLFHLFSFPSIFSFSFSSPTPLYLKGTVSREFWL